MKPIIGEASYKDMTPADIDHYIHEAKLLRAEAVHDHLNAAGRLIARLFTPFAKKKRPTKATINRSDMVGA